MTEEQKEGNKIIALWSASMLIRDYHSDWRELMPVVEKISRTVYECRETQNGDDSYMEYETAYPRTFGMINSQTGNFMFRYNRSFLFEAPTLIEACWLATVDFIKRLNK